MKLILQVALGVFLGTLASQFVIDGWHSHKSNHAKLEAAQLRTQQDKIRKEQGERIRNLILQNRQGNTANPSKPPIGFMPDDAK